MALQKQGTNINFGQGLDTKTDPDQVEAGKMLLLQNAVFNKGGQLTKRFGFGDLTVLPDLTNTTLTTLNDNLLATGTRLNAFSSSTNEWIDQGLILPVDVSVLPLVRNSGSQTACDTAISSSGLIAMVYTQASVAYYEISDAVTGQAFVKQTALPATSTVPRVFTLGNYFVITFIATVAGNPHLQYISIPLTMPASPSAAVDITTTISGLSAAYDGVVANNNLYLAWNANDGGGAVRTLYLTSTLMLSSIHVLAGSVATLMSVTADVSGNTPVIWISFWDSGSTNAYTSVFNQVLTPILAATQIVTTEALVEITSVATGSLLTFLYQTSNVYSFSSVRTDYLSKVTCTSAGVVGTPSVILRSVGLASKAFFNSELTGYVLATYGQSFQPTYFLIDWNGNVVAKLAYSNGAGYASNGILPSVAISEDVARVAYLIKDLIVPVNKTQGAADASGIFTQTGINLATFDINLQVQHSTEIAQALHLTGGFIWEYDGIKPVEHSFHVWPEDIVSTTNAAGGSITDQQYFYSFTYEWTDGQGLLHRSAPSVPVGQLTAGGNTSTNTINVPTLRLTYKIAPNPVRIVGYRWSTAQQIYYQFTSITSPTLNDTTVDSVAITDTLADSAILGNTILYTTGGVVENIAAPANNISTLYKSRLFVLDSEDRNLLWFSKQVIEATPVEMSDLLTVFIAPTSGAQGSTGPITALSAMDDKIIIFKRDAIYYMTGTGPDNTGAQNDFSDPIFITSTVGCNNQNSIVFQPRGIMFQSDKGIWLLGRDMSTSYVGAAVESSNNAVIKSALSVPGTNQVRFTLDNGSVLMYDYYYDQWGSFNGVPAISSTLYQGMHTFLNSLAQVRQETPDAYLDGTNPVLLKFTSAWFRLTGLQGFQRAYWLFLLSNYITPHKLNIQIAYDYDSAITQSTLITPDNFNPNWGADSLWGGSSPWGGNSNVEQWRVFLNRQKCEAIQVTVSEIYDASLGVTAGAGLTMSGLNIVFGAKTSYPKLNPSRSAS